MASNFNVQFNSSQGQDVFAESLGDGKAGVIHHLYEISTIYNGETINVFILAPSEEEACQQAECHRTNTFSEQKKVQTALIRQVPFGIRGWSGHKF